MSPLSRAAGFERPDIFEAVASGPAWASEPTRPPGEQEMLSPTDSGSPEPVTVNRNVRSMAGPLFADDLALAFSVQVAKKPEGP